MRNYLKYFGLLILLILSFSCKQEAKNKNFIDKLSSIQNGLPSPYFRYYLYFKMNNDRILETNIDTIYELYKKHYFHEYPNFNIYLMKIIAQEEVIKEQDITTLQKEKYFFNISDTNKNIEKMSVENIENKYLKVEKQNSFLLSPKSLEITQIKTILYKMFINNYVITLNDFAGYYNITKYNEKDWRK